MRERQREGEAAAPRTGSSLFNPFRTLAWQTPDGRGLCAVGSLLPYLRTGAPSAAVALPPVQLHYEDRGRRPWGPCLPGQLTDVGRERMRALGGRPRRPWNSPGWAS